MLHHSGRVSTGILKSDMKTSTLFLLPLWSDFWIITLASLSSAATINDTSPSSSTTANCCDDSDATCSKSSCRTTSTLPVTSGVGHCGIRCIEDCITSLEVSLFHGSFCCCSSSTLASSNTHSGTHFSSTTTLTSTPINSSIIPSISTLSKSTHAPSTRSSAIPHTQSTHSPPTHSSAVPHTRSSTTVSSIASTFTQTFPPTPSTGSSNITVAAFDPRISYMKGDWANSSACSGQSRSASQPGSTLVFQFFGSAVYMKIKLGANDSVLNVTLDGSSADVRIPGADSGALNCVLAWSAWNLTNGAHTVQVEVMGASINAPFSNSTKPGGSGIAFVLNEFLITQDEATISSISASASGSSTSTSPSSSPALASHGTAQVVRASYSMATLLGAIILILLRGG